MTFPKITEEPCPTNGGNGDGDIPILILKPGVVTGCAGSIQFQAFLQTPSSGETLLTSGAVFQSTSSAVIVIDATTGLATLVSAGQATVTVTYGEMSAQAQITVQGSESACCDDVAIATSVVVDDSKSMSKGRSIGTRLAFAKDAAKAFFGATRWGKDTAGLIRFNSGPVIVQAIGSTQVTNTTIDGIAQTANQTDIGAALAAAIAAVNVVTADRRVIVLISDGEHRPVANGIIPSTAAIVATAQAFKAAGGIIIGIACDAAADGFALMQAISTPGFFVNAYNDLTREQAIQQVVSVMCYYCAGTVESCCQSPSGGDSLVPTMTDNTTPSGIVTAQTTDTAEGGWYFPFDGTNANCFQGPWTDGAVSSDTWLQYQFTAAQTVRSYKMACHLFPLEVTPLSPPSAWTLQGSNNGTNWTTVDSRSGITSWVDYELKTFSVASPGSYTYYRLTFTAVVYQTGSGLFCLTTLQFFDAGCLLQSPVAQVPDPDPLPDLELSNVQLFTSTKTACVACGTTGEAVNLVPAMTSNTAPEGEVIAGDVGGFQTAHAYLTFDRTNGTWDLPAHVRSGYVGYHFTSAQIITAYTIKTKFIASAPKSFTFEGSNDGVAWDVLDTVADSGGWAAGQTKSFSFSNVTAYEYYRLNISDITGPAFVDSWNIPEMEMFGTPPILRCATRTATSYVDQATADAAADAAALAAAQALCGVSNNGDPINIPALGSAIPYPSVQVVTGLTGTITKVVLKLYGISHGSPDDIQMLLVSPTGTKVKVWQNAGGLPPHGVTSIDVNLDDDAADPLPDDDDITAGDYQPAQYAPGGGVAAPLSINPPAPPLPYDTALNAFIGEDPNGSWSLYVMDDLSVFGGVITSWEVVITAA